MSEKPSTENRKRKAEDVDEQSQSSSSENKKPRNIEATKSNDNTTNDEQSTKGEAKEQAEVKDALETNGKRARSEEPDAKGKEPETKRPRTDTSEAKTELEEEKKVNDKRLEARLDAMDAKDKEKKSVPKPEVNKTNGGQIPAHPSGGWSNRKWVVPSAFDSKEYGWKFPDEIVEEPMDFGGGGRGRGRGRGDRGDKGGRGGGRGGRGGDRGGRGRGRPS